MLTMGRVLNFLQKGIKIEIYAAIVLFSIAVILGQLIEFIIYMLYFIIFLEILRGLIEFSNGKRIRIRILIDAFIILALREFIVNVVKINNTNLNSIEDVFSLSLNYHILIFSGVLLFLFFIRFLAILTAPEKFE
jgi:uncharacterized membrane protein (DUF373 family)